MKNDGPAASGNKGQATRERIVQAARRVFSRHPYTSASIRMIAKEGGFNHPLIHHYFPSKADLFVTVAQELYEEYACFSGAWLDGVWEMGLVDSLATSVDRIVNDCFDHPDALRCVMQNIAHGIPLEDLPGAYFPDFWRGIEKAFQDGLSPHACKEHIRMWILGFHMVVFNSIGAPYYHARVMGMEPESGQYKQWVKDALLFLFYPSLKQLVFSGPGDERPKTWEINPLSLMPAAPAFFPGNGGSLKLKKGEQTRLHILEAARTVFAAKPYNTASIRMIGHEGGFDFTLIHHYFPSKAHLFEALATRIFEEILPQAISWLEGLGSMDMEQGISVFADRALDYCFKHPEGVLGLMQNIAQLEDLDDIPGFRYFPLFHSQTQQAFRQATGIRATEDQVKMCAFGVYLILYNCVGAAGFPSQLMGLDPKSAQYRQWVKDFIMFLILPVVERMVESGQESILDRLKKRRQS